MLPRVVCGKMIEGSVNVLLCLVYAYPPHISESKYPYHETEPHEQLPAWRFGDGLPRMGSFASVRQPRKPQSLFMKTREA